MRTSFKWHEYVIIKQVQLINETCSHTHASACALVGVSPPRRPRQRDKARTTCLHISYPFFFVVTY